jgi:hypothetical protein
MRVCTGDKGNEKRDIGLRMQRLLKSAENRELNNKDTLFYSFLSIHLAVNALRGSEFKESKVGKSASHLLVPPIFYGNTINCP